MYLFYMFMWMFFFLSVLFFMMGMLFIYNSNTMIFEWSIYNFNSIEFNVVLYFDYMSCLFMSIVLIISSMIMGYSMVYMNLDKNKFLFINLLFLFILSMMVMIIMPNLISIMLGWDGLGLISYCLVIYYKSISSYNSGMLTFLSNRVGDVTLIISISMLLGYGGFNSINFYLIDMKSMEIMFGVGMLMISSITKSAQIPFSSWLPAAMAAPTPISSLVHSSTLVTAGVYLLIRFKMIIYKFPMILMYFLIISLMTMLYSGVSAMSEFDLKKIIALSTLSQLGLMISIYCIGLNKMSFFHLITHAMFKSLLFMCSGVIIHMMYNNQDIRYLGNLIKFIPFTMMMFNLSSLSLCGIPFMSGFYSKDQMLEYGVMGGGSGVFFMIMYMSIGITMIYSFRVLYYSMMKMINFNSFMNIMEDKLMNYSMIYLMVLSLLGGVMLNWLMFNSMNMIFLSLSMKLLILEIMGMGGGVCFIFVKMKVSLMNLFLKNYFSKMWFLVMNINYLNKYFLMFSKLSYINNDKGWVEIFGKNSVSIYMNIQIFDKIMFMNFMLFMKMLMIMILSILIFY